MDVAADPLDLGLLFGPAAAMFLLVLAAVLTVPISFFVQMRYRRAVLRSMMDRAAAVPVAPPEPAEPAGPSDHAPAVPAAGPLPLRFVEAGARGNDPADFGGSGAPLLTRFLNGPRHAALVYGMAGVAFSILANAIYMAINNLEFFPRRTLTLTLISLWPLVLTIPRIWREPGLRWYAFALPIYFGLIALLGREHFGPLVVGFWLWTWVPPTVAIFLLANREIRAVSPLVFVTTVVFVGGAHVAFLALYFALKASRGAETDENAVFTFVGLLSLAVCGALAWAALRLAARSYERRWVGEQTVLIDSYYLIFTLWLTLTEANTRGAKALWLLVPFVVYRALVAAGMVVLRRRIRGERPLRLLLLRVFGSRSRSESLFETVGNHWRYAGSIQMIAGTDLATATLEPHEFLDFVGGTLTRRFVKGPGDLSERLARLDTEPDADARFRVNEFFCHDDTWRDVLLRLVAESDAVLMDLRTFSPRRQGCVFELHQLLNLIPLRRVLLLVDDTTDVPFLRRVLETAWETLAPESPNRGGAGGELRIVHLKPGRESSRSLLALLASAASDDGEVALPGQSVTLPPGVPDSPLVR